MPARSSLEKSPVDPREYEGLQVDTRAQDNNDLFLDETKPQGFLDDDFDNHINYINEKQAHAGWGCEGDPRSPQCPESPDCNGTTIAGSPLPPLPQQKNIDSVFHTAAAEGPQGPPVAQQKRIFGLKRKHFWEIFGLVLALVIAAAVVGGVVGGLQSENVNAPSTVTNASMTSHPPTPNTPILPGDILADSPLNAISYDAGGSGDPASRQSFRIYYQSALGNIKEAVSNGQSSWQDARPIFTDALNNTGLATVTYLNGTQQQGSIFYAGMNGLVQEKRKIFNNTLYWEPGTINNLNLPAVGNITLPSEKTPDPKNGVGSYAMAAVYSGNFNSGPGIRLFYHAELLNGTSYVQEMVWNQAKDTWTKGVQISNVWPNSKMAATIDDSNDLLRLFFTSGDGALQEVFCNIRDPNWKYEKGELLNNPLNGLPRDVGRINSIVEGLEIQNYLSRNTADLSAVSENGTTYVYHYATINQTANVGIHELAISGLPGSYTNQESYNLSEPLVYSPNLTLANNGQSAFQPLAATKTVVSGVDPEVLLFWAQQVTGDPNALSGYHALSETSKHISNSTWPNSQPMPVPLGSSNTFPSTKRSIFPRRKK